MTKILYKFKGKFSAKALLMLQNKAFLLLLLSFLLFLNCKEDPGIDRKLPALIQEDNSIAYAEGFSITNHSNFKVLTVNNPWPKAEKTYKYVLISKEDAAKTSFMKDEYDGIIITPVTSIVVTSTTHIPALELLNEENSLIGFPGSDYISSEKIRQRIDNGHVRELGKNANVDYLYADTKSQGSLALSFEAVFEKAKHANLWLSPSYYSSMEALQTANTHYTQFDAFKNNAIYTFANTTGKTGGVLYYELGLSRPDLVLKDIIKICHPDLLPEYQTYFFKPLK